jgi:hypothetical protein
MDEQSMERWAICVTGLAALLAAVISIGLLVTPHFQGDGSSASGPLKRDAPSITSEQAIAIVKDWISGGTEVGFVEEFVGSLPCRGHYLGRALRAAGEVEFIFMEARIRCLLREFQAETGRLLGEP